MLGLNQVHRWLGLVAALSIIVLSLTGIALNHSDELSLGKRPLPDTLSSWLYGITASRQDYSLAGLTISSSADSLIVEDEHLGSCSGKIVESFMLSEYNAVICQQEVYLLTESGELIEELSATLALGKKILAVALDAESEHSLIVRLSDKTVKVNLESASAVELDPAWQNYSWASSELPFQQPDTITWQRFLYDIHAGRFFAGIDKWLMDGVALILLYLVFSGLLSWHRKNMLLKSLGDD